MYEIAWVSPGLVNVMFGPCGEGCYWKMMLSGTNHVTFWPRKVQFRQHRLNPFSCVRGVHREAGLGLENVWNWHVTNCNAERSLITKAYFCWWVTGRLQEVLPQKTLLKWILLPSQFFFLYGHILGTCFCNVESYSGLVFDTQRREGVSLRSGAAVSARVL